MIYLNTLLAESKLKLNIPSDIKKIYNSAIYFILRRIIELFSVVLAGLSLLLVISLVSYSPDDPNFIFPDNTVIKNLLGSNGSYVSDVFMQSFGLMSFLIPITFFFTSIRRITISSLVSWARRCV